MENSHSLTTHPFSALIFTPLGYANLFSKSGHDCCLGGLSASGVPKSGLSKTLSLPFFQRTMDILNQKSESLLSISASHGHLNVVKWLISKKAALNHRTSENCTPLFLASMNGHTEVVKELLKSKADPLISRLSR